jgi:hypothetical protein
VEGFLRLFVISHGISGHDLSERLAGFSLSRRRLPASHKGVVYNHLDLDGVIRWLNAARWFLIQSSGIKEAAALSTLLRFMSAPGGKP